MNKERNNSRWAKGLLITVTLIVVFALLAAVGIKIYQNNKKANNDIKTFEYTKVHDGIEDYTIDVEMNTENNSYRYKVSSEFTIYRESAIIKQQLNLIESTDTEKIFALEYDEEFKIELNQEFSNWIVADDNVVTYDQGEFFIDENNNTVFYQYIYKLNTNAKVEKVDELVNEEQSLHATLNFQNQTFTVAEKPFSYIKTFEYTKVTNGIEDYTIDVEINTKNNSYRYKVSSEFNIYSSIDDQTFTVIENTDIKKSFAFGYNEKFNIELNQEFSSWIIAKDNIVTYDQSKFFVDENNNTFFKQYIYVLNDHKETIINEVPNERQSLHVSLNFSSRTLTINDEVLFPL